MSPRLKGQWRPSLFKLMLMFVALLSSASDSESARRGHNQQVELNPSTADIDEPDPMEPCYLSNNRASESLTISESTPVGTVVGEIMVNGDSSTNGNIELSIRMPSGGQSDRLGGDAISRQSSSSASLLNQQINGYPSPGQSADLMSRRSGQFAGDGSRSVPARGIQLAKNARDLSNLIDLMPPLSIEQDTKRLILAKKLDRENLDRYITAGGYQSSSLSSSSLSQSSSSASLTVHVKCQLKERKALPIDDSSSGQSNATLPGNNSLALNQRRQAINREDTKTKISKTSSYANSILIPIHLIVTDENDNWPVFINSPYIIDLNETVQVGSLLPGNEIVAIDNDQQGPLSTIEYSIVAGSLWSDSFGFLNPLDSRSLIVKDNSLLDYEAQSKLSLKVMARDQGEPPNWAITSLYINLFDTDDLNPIFGEDKYFGHIKDNQPGEVIDLMPKRLTARDGDRTINAPIVYSFHTKTNHSIHFDLDPDLGKLSLRKSLSLDESVAGAKQPFCLLIRASQLDNPQRWSLSMINMRISRASGQLADPSAARLEHLLAIGDQQASNQDSPSPSSQQSNTFKFPLSNYTVEVSESAPPGFTVLNLGASFNQPNSRLSSPSDDITYLLLDNEAGYFNLEPRSGKLTLNRSLDFELYRHLSVRVLATHEYHDEPNNRKAASPSSSHSPINQLNNHYPKLLCDITRINVNVINQNDHKPEFSHEQYNFQLSVSDLIANFELPQMQDNMDNPSKQVDSDPNRRQARSSRILSEDTIRNSALSKRFGETDLDDLLNEDPLEWRAMQLGQIYCADRDYGDKLTLQLTGSKVSLFHLTQDGRLYLPLVNLTSQKQPISVSGASKRNDQQASTSRAINNRFVQSRLFSSRRNDYQDIAPDRNYLNYLLGEVSNLGRLRLKVTASDNGHPEAHQTTALIVITIISIDNFILQQAPQLPRGLEESSAALNGSISVKLSNETSYDSTSNRADLPSSATDQARDKFQRQQVMMIPATNGRSFVQINPDIIGNLISHQGLTYSRHAMPSIEGNSVNSTSNSLSVQTIRGTPVAGGTQSGAVHFGAAQSGASPPASGGASGLRLKPPSLLLVDDDGAKFVAMPAAMEVFERQVQEAADLQQARQIGETDPVRRNSRANNGKPMADSESQWWTWILRFGFKLPADQQEQTSGGWSQWMNASTAIMLHLLALVVIVTLLSKLKSSLATRRTGTRSARFGGHLWPVRFRQLPFAQAAAKGRADRSACSILDQANLAIGRACLSSSDSSDGGSFLARQQRASSQEGHHCTSHTTDSSHCCSSSTDSVGSATRSSPPLSKRHQVTGEKRLSCGVVVSAMSNGYQVHAAPQQSLAGAGKNANNLSGLQGSEALEIAKQSNLFGHLKLTLNKMLDSSHDEDDKGCRSVGQVTIRALDSDLLPFDSHRSVTSSPLNSPVGSQTHADHHRPAETRSPSHTTKEIRTPTNGAKLSRQIDRSHQVVTASNDALNHTKSSTFVGGGGGGQRIFSPNQSVGGQLQSNDRQLATSEEATAVVSIDVAPSKLSVDLVPKKSTPNTAGRQSAQPVATSNSASSSSSSVVSLVSISSSIISNRIKAAVERTSCENTTGSDVSSLDSTTLFNGLPTTSSGRTRRGLRSAGQPPAPPPPPPPPSLVQVRMESPPSSLMTGTAGRQQQQCGESKPFSARPADGSIVSAANPRRPLPQNPLHVKLKQQAAVVSAGGSTVSDTATGRRNEQGRFEAGSLKRRDVSTSTPTAPSRDTQIKANKQTIPVEPPTPPPLPSDPAPSGCIKTVSPTTSVDRGYESLQSYTSSSQPHQLQQRPRTVASGYAGAINQRPPDLQDQHIDCSIASRQVNPLSALPRDTSPSSCKSKRNFAPNSAQSNGQYSPVAGRQSQRSLRQIGNGSPRQVYKTMIEADSEVGLASERGPAQVNGSSGQRAKQPRASARSALPTASVNSGSAPVSGRRQRPSLILGTAPPGPIVSPMLSRQLKSNCGPARAAKSRVRLRDQATSVRNPTTFGEQNPNKQQVDDETEDDDFYYCYKQSPQMVGLSTEGSHNLLSNYDSHAYTDNSRYRRTSSTRGRHKELRPSVQDYDMDYAEAEGDGMIELARALANPANAASGMQLPANGTDLMLNSTAAMMYHLAGAPSDMVGEQRLPAGHHHRQQQGFSQIHQTQQRNLQNLAQNQSNATSNKKVLTWSDQVGLA